MGAFLKSYDHGSFVKQNSCAGVDEVEKELLFDVDFTFDSMMAGHSLDDQAVLTIHANQYARQNIKELPGIHLIGNTPSTWAGEGGLGAIWLTSMWRGERDKLLVDADPSWTRFIDDLLGILFSRVPRVEIVLFYWP